MKKILIVLISTVIVFGQTKDPYAILNKVKSNFTKVKDYKVEAMIKVKMDFIKVPDMKATIYFKQPNKLKLDSKEFAMLPKQAFNFSPIALLESEFNALIVGEEKINGKKTNVIKVIPNSDSADVILSTLWIDSEKNFVRKIVSTGKRGTSTQIELSYDNNIVYPLPKKIIFSFDVPKMQNMPDPRDKKIGTEKKNEQKQPERGVVEITYSNYNVNQGLPDNLFEDKKK